MKILDTERQTLRKQCGQIWLETNIKLTPKLLIERINLATKKATKEGFVNITVASYISKDEWENEQSYYLTLVGERIETEEEYNNRINAEKRRLRRERDEYLSKKKMYESEYGQEILKIIEQ